MSPTKKIDIARPTANKTTKTKPGTAGFTDEERSGMDNYINHGLIDTFREFNTPCIGIVTKSSQVFRIRDGFLSLHFP